MQHPRVVYALIGRLRVLRECLNNSEEGQNARASHRLAVAVVNKIYAVVDAAHCQDLLVSGGLVERSQ